MLQIVKFEIQEYPGVFIEYVPEFKSVLGDKPPFWFIHKHLSPWDKDTDIHARYYWKEGFRRWLWNGKYWVPFGMKQYESAYDAEYDFLNYHSLYR